MAELPDGWKATEYSHPSGWIVLQCAGKLAPEWVCHKPDSSHRFNLLEDSSGKTAKFSTADEAIAAVEEAKNNG